MKKNINWKRLPKYVSCSIYNKANVAFSQEDQDF